MIACDLLSTNIGGLQKQKVGHLRLGKKERTTHDDDLTIFDLNLQIFIL
jgi:hypothetical protein